MLPYSQRKSKEKRILYISVLKPDTNSDSPSEKSKGARFSSANPEIKKTRRMRKGKKVKTENENEK